ncbi:MAG: pantetheine-phosphate adenylyltransferase [Bacteroidaceae bacterium]|nr:pantetheine-phosphate adenylyltransferase [Bacteroidaceae bacterium]
MEAHSKNTQSPLHPSASQEAAGRIALFPGSFDPFTIGHADIVKRGLDLFDKIVIAVGVNASKHHHFTAEERVQAIRKLYDGDLRIEVTNYDDLTVDLAQRVGAKFILRGIRSVKDFEYERDIASINKRLADVETVFLFSDPAHADISSGVVRELMAYGKDVSAFLP